MTGPHQGQPLARAGVPLEQARAAMVCVHGRGATAASILELASVIDAPGFACLAPQAAANTWYPNRFLAPISSNEPGITSGLQAIHDAIGIANASGIPREKVVLMGFSQGACLTLEYAARHAHRYGAIFGLSGGLIGPDGTARDYPGSFDGTPVFLGCSDVDPHIPLSRVHETATVLKRLGAEVETRVYPNMDHTVSPDEVKVMRAVLSGIWTPVGLREA
jgi:predicted esterase